MPDNATPILPDAVMSKTVTQQVKPKGKSFLVRVVHKLIPCGKLNNHASAAEIYTNEATRPVLAHVGSQENCAAQVGQVNRGPERARLASETSLPDSVQHIQSSNQIPPPIPVETDSSSSQLVGVVSEDLKSSQSTTMDILSLPLTKHGETDSDDDLANLLLTRDEGVTTKTLLLRCGFAHIGYVYLDNKGDEGVVIEKGFAIVVGAEGENCLKGLRVVPTADYEEQPVFRRVGTFVLNGNFVDDPDAPFCNLESWLSTPPEVVVII